MWPQSGAGGERRRSSASATSPVWIHVSASRVVASVRADSWPGHPLDPEVWIAREQGRAASPAPRSNRSRTARPPVHRVRARPSVRRPRRRPPAAAARSADLRHGSRRTVRRAGDCHLVRLGDVEDDVGDVPPLTARGACHPAASRMSSSPVSSACWSASTATMASMRPDTTRVEVVDLWRWCETAPCAGRCRPSWRWTSVVWPTWSHPSRCGRCAGGGRAPRRHGGRCRGRAARRARRSRHPAPPRPGSRAGPPRPQLPGDRHRPVTAAGGDRARRDPLRAPEPLLRVRSAVRVRPRAEFHDLTGMELLDAVTSWVGQRVAYIAGSSRPIDGAVATLLAGQGVCRELRVPRDRPSWCDTPARLVSVYAPWAAADGLPRGGRGLHRGPLARRRRDQRWPHAGRWSASPPVANAADTAFLTSTGAAATLTALNVVAVTDGELPRDDSTLPVQLA